MDINALNANLNRDKWGVRNFRALKSLLVKEVQESLSEFMPLTSSSYYNNPIQVLDFFVEQVEHLWDLQRLIPLFRHLRCSAAAISTRYPHRHIAETSTLL